MVENSEGDMYHGCDICSSLPNVSNSMQRYLERVALSIYVKLYRTNFRVWVRLLRST